MSQPPRQGLTAPARQGRYDPPVNEVVPALREAVEKGPRVVGVVVGVSVFVVGALIALISGHHGLFLAAALTSLLAGALMTRKLRRTITTTIEALQDQLAATAARDVVDINRDVVDLNRKPHGVLVTARARLPARAFETIEMTPGSAGDDEPPGN